MSGILEILAEAGFTCTPPSRADSVDMPSGRDGEDVGEVKAPKDPFEDPKPPGLYVQVEEKSSSEPLLLKYFIDGSMRTTPAGFINSPKSRHEEMFVSQVGVAVTELCDGVLKIEDSKTVTTLWLPGVFDHSDIEKAKNIVAEGQEETNFPIKMEMGVYNRDVQQNESAQDAVRKQVLKHMHGMEMDYVRELVNENKIKREAMLVIDGSLQFYQGLEENQEAFENVVGIAKSFDINRAYGSGKNPMNVATIASRLPERHRTPAHKIEHRNLLIGSWYIRLRSDRGIEGLRQHDGVVKVEIFPEDARSADTKLDHDRCNAISMDIVALRHPATPMTDSRWASHLYPVYATESYLKTQFYGNTAIRTCLGQTRGVS